MTILIFILIICIIVISHELGHFLLAKANGITVKEFFVGMGPTLCSFTKGGTKYSLKLFPVGGACMFEGEDGKSEENEDGEAAPLSPGAFPNANVWARISTVVAGPIFNFILAYLLALIMIGTTYSDKPVIQDVIPGFPAAEAGMRSGDVITRLGGEKIYVSREIGLITMLRQGETLTVEYMRDGETREAILTPKLDEESGRYLLGFQGYAEYFKCSPAQVFQYSYYEVRYGLKATLRSLQMLIQGKAGRDEISGPIGIAVLVDDVTQQTKPYGLWVVIVNLMNLAMLLSVNLGVINLLPLPALDGGRLVFLLLEVIRGKPIPPEKEGMVHLAGFAVLCGLMVLILYNDIVKLIH
ncbi:RIP metalloprotease RseP [Lachnospiraceae bacterium JLR.KK008]